MNLVGANAPARAVENRSCAWLLCAAAATLFWGVWGALIEIPEKAGFPATLGYSVWALTMAPCALGVQERARWKLDRDLRSVCLGSAVGFLGAGGQILLFQALRSGPAYLVFPVVSLYPVLSVVLATLLLKERARRRVWAGIIMALLAIAMLSYHPAGSSVASGSFWRMLSAMVFVMWGLQAYVMKLSHQSMTAESIFFYMAAGALALVPIAVSMTDWSQPIHWGWRGPYLAALIQALNSVGALCLVYALRYGKAIVVVPMTSLFPVLTILLSLALYRVIPHPIPASGMVLASIAIYLMAE